MGAILYKDKVYGAGVAGGGSGSSTLAGLTDVDLDNLSDGQVLKWNATTEKWENANESGGGTGQSVFVGTAVPSNSIGNDNDIYVKRSDYSPQLSYKYFKLTITKNRSNSNYTNLGQIVLRKDDNTELIWANYNATVTTNHAGVNANESIDKIIDNTSSTCYTTAYNPTSESPIVIVITTAVEVDLSEFTKYAWYTAKELSQRDMVSWTFSVSTDGVDWEVVDTVNNYDVTTSRSTLAYSNTINAHGSGSANPLTIDATYIKISGEWTEVEQNSGGTEVIANPEGEATDTLTKISIDDVIYEISGGGGGGGGSYSETMLWSGSGNMFTTLQILLSDAYTNYNALRFEYAVTRGDNIIAHYEKTVSVDTISIAQAASEQFAISDFFLYNNAGVAVYGTVVSTTELSSVYVSKNWFKACVLNKVVGLKISSGGGGGGSNYARTELFKSSTNLAVWDASGITLSDDIENYDEIEFVLAFASGTDMSKKTNKFGAKWFADNCGYTSAAASADHALLLLWPNQGFSAAWDSANQKIMMWGRNGSAGLYAVYGIKY